VEELRRQQVQVTQEAEPDVDAVVVGFDTELTSEKIRRTCQLLFTTQAAFIATNPDLRCPVSFGFIPDCGAICRMLECATGKQPVYIGKPEPVMVDFVREKFGFSAEETLVAGDRLYTDIAIGIHAGVTSVCVLTGEATEAEIRNGSIRPDYTFPSVRELYEALK
jgi:HAD superfamily hydrolase (TIGR01450 family)